MSFWSEVQLAKIPSPVQRRLRVYALDPSLSVQSATRNVAEAVVSVPWEDIYDRGPVGEYVEVVDFDDSTQNFYLPVDLNDPRLIANNGLAPSTGDPRFHQQMAYAVAMKTIRHFEDALGRYVLWRPQKPELSTQKKSSDKHPNDKFVQHLRIYPHAFRKQNAFYDPERVALLFGYFPAQPVQATSTFTGGLVFSCLSFDIVAHETTHAILDGMMRRFIEDTNPDVLAFHEGFADLIALFQHFTLADLLRHQIMETRGEMAADSLLGKLAVQFAEGSGRKGALRDAVGEFNSNGKWERATPDKRNYAEEEEPHQRGAILVSAVFDAFIAIYNTRIADLLRIASDGTGRVRPGALPHDLVARLADEASKVAGHLLNMLIRALDYCPPVDITFGEYLRAVLTADFEVAQDDRFGYRVAFIEAFRKWGIYPSDVQSLGEESLRWLPADAMLRREDEAVLDHLAEGLKVELDKFLVEYDNPPRPVQKRTHLAVDAPEDGPEPSKPEHGSDRKRVFELSETLRYDIHGVIGSIHEEGRGSFRSLVKAFPSKLVKSLLGVGSESTYWANLVKSLQSEGTPSKSGVAEAETQSNLEDLKNQEVLKRVLGIAYQADVQDGKPISLPYEVHEARISTRISPENRMKIQRDLIVQITQRCFVDRQSLKVVPKSDDRIGKDMLFRGGCTLVIDTATGKIRYVVRKRIESDDRRARQRDYQTGGPKIADDDKRPFEMLHGGNEF